MKKIRRNVSLNQRLAGISLAVFIPMILVMTYLLASLTNATSAYAQITKSVSYANMYARDFKERMDYSMYLAVIGKRDMEELGDGETTVNGILTVNPYKYIDELEETCDKLSYMATVDSNRNQIKRLKNSLKSLKGCVKELETAIDSGGAYEDKMNYLNENIYMLTSLIQEGIQDYIYVETTNYANVKAELDTRNTRTFVICIWISVAAIVLALFLTMKAAKSVTKPISKTFPGVKALQHVDFTLRKGEIHALMGENGAGKSTLIKVLTGVHPFESGEIKMEGKDAPIVNRSPQDAQDNGISTVYQEVNLCPNLTVAENLFIGREPRKAGLIDWKTMNKKSTELLKDLQIDAKATDKLEECSLAKQQMIAIARAVDMNCRVLILDEPTSSLDDDEVEKLFVLMNRLKAQGVGIIFVTHFLEQVYAVCDRITVLRNGELVGEYTTKDLPRVMLVAKMMGKDFDDLADIKGEHAELKEFIPVIEAEGIGRKGSIRPFNFTVNKGEVVGLTGLLGSGRSELVRAIYGADKPDSGKIKVNGKEVKINSPLDAMKLGMAYLPEDRKKDGIIADLSVRENIIIALQAKRGMFHPLSKKEMEEAADKYIEMLQIKTASRETPIKSLSGGNQQKVIIGRWLLTNPDYLILDEPTRGIDIGTKTEIQKLVLDLADQGMAVTFISSEVEEMLRTCSRMGVLRDGKKVGEISGNELSQEGIMKAIAGGGDNE